MGDRQHSPVLDRRAQVDSVPVLSIPGGTVGRKTCAKRVFRVGGFTRDEGCIFISAYPELGRSGMNRFYFSLLKYNVYEVSAYEGQELIQDIVMATGFD